MYNQSQLCQDEYLVLEKYEKVTQQIMVLRLVII